VSETVEDGVPVPEGVVVGVGVSVAVGVVVVDGVRVPVGKTVPVLVIEGVGVIDGGRHVPAGTVHVQYALVAEVVTAAADETVRVKATAPEGESTSSTHPFHAEMSAVSEGAHGAPPCPVLKMVSTRVCRFAGAEKLTNSHGFASHAHEPQPFPPTPRACHAVAASPSIAYDA
jgi:hypothetical protein